MFQYGANWQDAVIEKHIIASERAEATNLVSIYEGLDEENQREVMQKTDECYTHTTTT
jgi:hypothetical protein